MFYAFLIKLKFKNNGKPLIQTTLKSNPAYLSKNFIFFKVASNSNFLFEAPILLKKFILQENY